MIFDYIGFDEGWQEVFKPFSTGKMIPNLGGRDVVSLHADQDQTGGGSQGKVIPVSPPTIQCSQRFLVGSAQIV